MVYIATEAIYNTASITHVDIRSPTGLWLRNGYTMYHSRRRPP
jgi:hypothetical protein